jgi:NAD(P)-dependent dehydrogenase (short-subunit alcohol dehydrogenase family)
MRLKDKVAIITGGGTGIGKAIALGFAREGANLVLAQRRLKLAEAVASEIGNNGQEALALKVDISISSDLDTLVEKTIEKFGKIDILVNNSAIYPFYPFLEFPEDEIGNVIDINLKGTMICTQKVAREMVKRNYGKVVNISSTHGIRGMGSVVPYSATKGGINAFTRCAAFELGQYGITVNAILSGFVPHEEVRRNISEMVGEEGLNSVIKAQTIQTPMGRVGEVEDLVGLAIYLASDESRFMTAECIILDGGCANSELMFLPPNL